MSAKNIVVEKSSYIPPSRLPVEIVERKGTGHPDYIADSISEAASRELSRYYLEHYGAILHHNLDKVLVVGGQSSPRFGGGEVVQPIYILVSGRATTEVVSEGGRESVPVGPIILKATRDWIKSNIRFLDPDTHVIVDYRVGKGSADLVDIYNRRGSYPGANDTSMGIGYAPLSPTERAVLETERLLNSEKVKKELPAVGEDVKVMGVRKGNKLTLTVAMAVISRFVHSTEEYLSLKEEVKKLVKEHAASITDLDVEVYVNTGDDPSRGDKGGLYLTVTGTSAEHGDDGATGRGNRANGLITPFRPMSLEATAGKNPVSHIGKLYNVVAFQAASEICGLDHVNEVYIKLISQIGKPINQPLLAYIAINAPDDVLARVKHQAEEVLAKHLDRINVLWESILKGNVSLF
ncbi:methionine adenosyltransferase [Thermofilum pendens]|uniref:Methionine adenosyltransferase n=1 Tax=Thermofilum pendens (strain DSM 2475 / Hrk 5) TaxID=368408 RepID=A1RY59_THEPD|nr:methionine adenosyltransferase [Thermofilum pendens]ABL78139.1 methionine adenosyltransferase [Thermofilum pendens Hrk 5]